MTRKYRRLFWVAALAALMCVPAAWLRSDLSRARRAGAVARRPAPAGTGFAWFGTPFDRHRYRIGEFARPVPGSEIVASVPRWIDGHRFVADAGAGRWVEVDSRTGDATPLVAVTAFWRKPDHGSVRYVTPSPDGEWFVGLASKGGRKCWTAVHRDGVASREWPLGRYDAPYGPVAWMPDGSGFFVPGTDTAALNRYDLTEPEPFRVSVKAASESNFLPAGYMSPMAVTRDGRGYARGFSTQDRAGNVFANLFEYTFDSTSAKVRTVPVATIRTLTPLGISPDGRRFLWCWRDEPRPAQPSRDTFGLLVSDLTTGALYPVLPRIARAASEPGNREPIQAAWLPDGERVSLRYDGSLWVLPVDEPTPW